MDTLKQSIILFDLDGTLTDSEEGIIRSTQYMPVSYTHLASGRRGGQHTACDEHKRQALRAGDVFQWALPPE